MTTAAASDLTLTDEFLDALKLLDSGSHLFLSGKAGTGKSTLIRLFTDSTNTNLVVAAPTGVAALNVNGYTLHRLFSFPAGVTPEFARSDAYYPRRFAKILKHLDTLIIDEVSMVRADLFDSIAAALTRFGPKPGVPFGGVQIVLVGDLYQLPPVVADAEREYFSSVYSSPFFFAANAYQQDHFPTVELTTVFRQDGDPEFLSILNVLRDGQATPQAVEELNQHVDPDFQAPSDEFWLTLTTRNNTADKRNRQKLATLAAEEFTSTATMTGELDGFEKPTQDKLSFKVGAQIMLLTNDPQNRWVNGSLAVITTILRENDDYNVEIELQNQQRYIITPHTWEITRPSTSAGTLSHEVIGTFRQLPFRLAWAVTIHKAQGLTLDRCIIDLTGGAFADGQLYVALSRARSLTGLVLARPVRPRDLRINQEIRKFHHTHTGGETGEYVVLTANVVGDEGFQWRPRPIELAAILPDGTELTTLVDPQRDIGNASTTLGISAEDVVLAPTLPLAWAALEPHLAGRIPVGFDLAETLGFIDYELKRHEQIIQIPIGVEVKQLVTRRALNQLERPQPALAKARIIKEFLNTVDSTLPASTTFQPGEPEFGYLLPRGSESQARFMVNPDHIEYFTQYLSSLSAESKNSVRLVSILQGIEATTGRTIFHDAAATQRIHIADVLVPGANLCFTGNALDPVDGSPIDRSDLEALAAEHRLRSEDTLTKSRTDVLIVAEFGTQSGKARNARRWNKPIFSVEEFLAWTNGSPSTSSAPSDIKIDVTIDALPHVTTSPQEHPTPDGPRVDSQSVPEVDIPKSEAPEAISEAVEPTAQTALDQDADIPWSTESLDEFLVEGAVVSATGIIYHPADGHRIIQNELARILLDHGLRYEKNLTQRRTTLLLVGETDKTTRQLANAIEYGKPIFPAAQFFTWVDQQQAPAGRNEIVTPQISQIPAPPEVSQTRPAAASPSPSQAQPPPPPVVHFPTAPTFPSTSTASGNLQYAPSDKPAGPGPWWVGLPLGKFLLIVAGIPLGLAFIMPIMFMIFSVFIPSAETIMTNIAAVTMLCGFLSVPAALVFVGLRISGRRRVKQRISCREQRNHSHG